MKDQVMELGEFIRAQRQRSAISLRKLAERADVSNPYLSQIERGLRRPSAEILKGIARGLSISAETLYVRAGLLESNPNGTASVVEAIEADKGLTVSQRQALLEIYRSFLDH